MARMYCATFDKIEIANCLGRFDDIDNMLKSQPQDAATGIERAIYILIIIDGTSVVNNNDTLGLMSNNKHDKVINTQIIEFCIAF